MHTEPRDAVPLRVIVPNERVLGARHLPHPINSKKTARDFIDRDSDAIFYLSQMVPQARAKVPSLTHIHRRTAAKKNVHTGLARSLRCSQRVFWTGLQRGNKLVLIGLIYIELKSVAVAHSVT
jgi:hypothetical protein